MSQHADQSLSPGGAADVSAAADVPPVVRVPWVATWVMLLSVAAIGNGFFVAWTHGTRGLFLPALTLCICLLAALFDGWTQRIPNQLTYIAILLGLCLNGVESVLESWQASAAVTWLGAPGMSSAALGFGLCGTLGLIAGFMGAMHGGDIKLFAAVGALAGFEQTASISLVALTAALVYAVINLALLGRLTMVIRVAAQRVLELFYLRRLETPVPVGEKPTHVPMAIPLAVGVIVVTYLSARAGVGK